jgi:hypothetical protein
MQAAKAWSMKRRGFRGMRSPKFCCRPPGAQGKRAALLSRLAGNAAQSQVWSCRKALSRDGGAMADVLATAARSAIIFSTAASFLVSPSVAALLAGGNSTIGMCEDRSQPPGDCDFCGWWGVRLSRWRYRSLAWSHSPRGGRRAADLARLPARQPVQRAGGARARVTASSPPVFTASFATRAISSFKRCWGRSSAWDTTPTASAQRLIAGV